MYARRYGTPRGNYTHDIFLFELSLGNISNHAYAGVHACVRGVQTYTETVMYLVNEMKNKCYGQLPAVHWSVCPCISSRDLTDEYRPKTHCEMPTLMIYTPHRWVKNTS
jgi:hypothetical protein